MLEKLSKENFDRFQNQDFDVFQKNRGSFIDLIDNGSSIAHSISVVFNRIAHCLSALPDLFKAGHLPLWLNNRKIIKILNEEMETLDSTKTTETLNQDLGASLALPAKNKIKSVLSKVSLSVYENLKEVPHLQKYEQFLILKSRLSSITMSSAIETTTIQPAPETITPHEIDQANQFLAINDRLKSLQKKAEKLINQVKNSTNPQKIAQIKKELYNVKKKHDDAIQKELKENSNISPPYKDTLNIHKETFNYIADRFEIEVFNKLENKLKNLQKKAETLISQVKHSTNPQEIAQIKEEFYSLKKEHDDAIEKELRENSNILSPHKGILNSQREIFNHIANRFEMGRDFSITHPQIASSQTPIPVAPSPKKEETLLEKLEVWISGELSEDRVKKIQEALQKMSQAAEQMSEKLKPLEKEAAALTKLIWKAKKEDLPGLQKSAELLEERFKTIETDYQKEEAMIVKELEEMMQKELPKEERLSEQEANLKRLRLETTYASVQASNIRIQTSKITVIQLTNEGIALRKGLFDSEEGAEKAREELQKTIQELATLQGNREFLRKVYNLALTAKQIQKFDKEKNAVMEGSYIEFSLAQNLTTLGLGGLLPTDLRRYHALMEKLYLFQSRINAPLLAVVEELMMLIEKGLVQQGEIELGYLSSKTKVVPNPEQMKIFLYYFNHVKEEFQKRKPSP